MAHIPFGDGPGIQTPDGCSVELYRRLPYMAELNDIEQSLVKHKAALELGCGTGRLCGRLQELGLEVAGVDESQAMLAHLPTGVEGIHASIETLNLNRSWPAVLLPSHLINHPEEAVRKGFVRAAHRHTSASGSFYVKRHSREWISTVCQGPLGTSHGIALHAEGISRSGNLLSMTIRYETPDTAWTQSFTTLALDKQEIEQLLSSCGFIGFEWFGSEELWVAASRSDALIG